MMMNTLKRFMLAACLLVAGNAAFAMTAAQLVTLKAGILAETDPTFAAARAANESGTMATFLNSDSTAIVWKNSVPLSQVVANVDGVELVGLTAIKLAAYQSLLLAGSVNPSNARTRAGFDNVFSSAGGATTRPLLLALWKRTATRGEKLFMTGSGTDASPGAISYEGTISNDDVNQALAS